METSSIILLVVSASFSFALGRVFVHFRDKKRKTEKDRLQKLAAQAVRNAPPQAESQNKAKRKRQLRSARRDEGDEAN